MANIKATYAASAAVTITVASLAANAAREGTLVDNTSNLYLDAELTVKVQPGAVQTGDVHVLLSSVGDTTTVSTPATGTDAAITIPQLDKLGTLSPGMYVPGTNLVYMGKISQIGQAANTAMAANFGSVAACFGGNLPTKWAPVIVNTGVALSATATQNAVNYVGVFATSV